MEAEKYKNNIIIFTFFVGLSWMLYLLFNTTVTPFMDEIGHFLISRDSFNAPELILNFWGRTVHTLIYIIPAQFGLIYARLVSIFLAVLTAILTLKVAKILKIKYYYFVPLFLFFQPWFLNLSWTMLTEIPFSLSMILGVYLYLKRYYISSSVIIGLLPLMRHEGIILVGIWFIYMMYKKKWHSAFSVFVPLIFFNLIFYYFQQAWPLFNYLASKPTNHYGSGAWYHFLLPLFSNPKAVGLPICLLLAFSFFSIKKSSSIIKKIFLFYLSYFLIHTIIFRFGLYASGGYYEFLLPLAPAIAIAAALGLQWFINTIIILPNKKDNKSIISSLKNEKDVVIILCLIIVFFPLLFIMPYSPTIVAVASRNAAEWIRNNNFVNNNIISTHVYFYYYLPLRIPVSKDLWTESKLRSPFDLPSDTIVIWDRQYSNRWGLPYDFFILNSEEWCRLADFENKTVIIFKKSSCEVSI